MPSDPLISPSVAGFIASGLSITVASRSERLVPSIARAVACHVSADLRTVTVLLFVDQAEALCEDIARSARVAVCFTRPSNHQTLQLKGHDAQVHPATPQDVAAARRSLDLFAQDIGPLGWAPEYVDALFWRDPEQLRAVRFTPDGAFVQTPGPHAGRPLTA